MGELERPDPSSQALIRLIPLYGEVVAKWRDETYQRDRERAERMSAAAAESIDLGDLLEAMRADERVSDMFRDAVEAAIHTGEENKLRLLGRALANGALASDNASIDEAQQLLRLAVDLEAVDLRAVLHLQGLRGAIRDPRARLTEEMGMSRAAAEIVVARLLRLGLLEVETEAELNDPADRQYGMVDIDQRHVLTQACAAVLDLLTAQVTE